MKLFVFLICCAAFAAATYDFNRGSYFGRDDFLHDFSGNSGGVDSYEKYGVGNFQPNLPHRIQVDSGERSNMRSDSRETSNFPLNYINRVRTVEHVEKTVAKHDDDVKVKILNDPDLVLKQKFVLDILRNVYQNLSQAHLSYGGNRIVDGETNYKNFDKVVEAVRIVTNKQTVLQQGRIFTINNKVHHKQTSALFDLFVNSKNFNVFQRNVMWARNNINEEMFVHAFTAAILHRDDCVGIKLPALYEIVPHKFHTGVTIEKALKLKSSNIIDQSDLVIFNKYTNDYMALNDEARLAYLTEDIGWNLYHYYFHVDFATWIGGKDFNLYKERRGEKYLNLIQQLLARYNLERVSHGLGDIKEISLWTKVKTGYNPQMVYTNGVPVTFRNNYYDIHSTEDFYLMNRVDDYGRRIRDAIDKGYSKTYDGGKVDMKRPDAVDILGNMIQHNKDSVNTQFYGRLVGDFAKLLGGGHIKNVDHDNVIPSVMDHHETALRDPVTYQLYKYIMKMHYQFKDYLPAYKGEDLILDGVRVDNIKTTKLVTYFDYFDVDITNVVNTGRTSIDANIHQNVNQGSADRIIRARHMRLNHKPFSINIDVTCNHPQRVVVRTFLGPKFDNSGNPINLRNNRENFVEIDKTTKDLQAGRNTIRRNSRDFVYTVKDRTTYVDIYRRVLVNNDAKRLVDMHVDEANCGFPDRLVLPKGWVGGMPLQIFVVVTKAKDVVKYDTEHVTMICGKHSLINDVDDKALGFPFDRRIDETVFYTPNMLFKDVYVYHNTDDSVRSNIDVGGVRSVVGSHEDLNVRYSY